ncbi:DUF1643 domain-containing protein [Bacillus cereus]|nr:DUF1643 domain-containing protein [Bacillus cereus]PGA32228.1 hypothetical protein COL88_31370 [Bacillus thuringiensis]PET62760.1 hypothetical protein CN522_19570 [Bacillus cereus]PEZ49842.1 hypothetical protein CN363_22970 [Bacillus cereus]PFH69321.1 hypothetical protein COI62_11800 [Bacillus cereus]PFQ11584.1 hypothetical protein COK04_20370 [Bacillus cereus]
MGVYDNRYIDFNGICTDKYLLDKNNETWIRTYLSIPLKGVKIGIDIAIIMMNPSHADNKKSDKSVNRVIDFFVEENLNNKQKIKKIHILNLFPICSPKPKKAYQKLIELYKSNQLLSVMQDNNTKIENIMQKCKYVVLAWGLPSKSTIPYMYFHQRALIPVKFAKIYEIEMKVFEVSGTTTILCKTGDPRHPAGLRGKDIIGLYTLKQEDLFGLGAKMLH